MCPAGRRSVMKMSAVYHARAVAAPRMRIFRVGHASHLRLYPTAHPFSGQQALVCRRQIVDGGPRDGEDEGATAT
jgi:hypothetical protein